MPRPAAEGERKNVTKKKEKKAERERQTDRSVQNEGETGSIHPTIHHDLAERS